MTLFLIYIVPVNVAEATCFGVLFVEAVQKRRHPALDAGTPLLDNGWRCRISVRHDDIDDDDSNVAPPNLDNLARDNYPLQLALANC